MSNRISFSSRTHHSPEAADWIESETNIDWPKQFGSVASDGNVVRTGREGYKNDDAARVEVATSINRGKRAQMMIELRQHCAFCRTLSAAVRRTEAAAVNATASESQS